LYFYICRRTLIGAVDDITPYIRISLGDPQITIMKTEMASCWKVYIKNYIKIGLLVHK